ncbi:MULTISPECIES: hypothetical protein [unclassified Lentimonas]|uniref:hypothetical protein n=1 Tax=unclassified Lentimonas TaxID=2630993 RepID=UPI001325FE1C|nr:MULTISPECIES: hypothetical protein [unclassified Lentimonas]CAA6676673.1 Unannotated [Lentimonas sp. CC4]CAA6684663.1 Unannotated [Lentimonas sp. CC6]CAA6694150.1 Unannotated [Lentimonas sp. CC19]CAA6694353.1 Unannotated [Lentimonas sp. CC10]CAA7070369.1 Unannotated [Lentimonas sp. CC11]
MKLPLTLSIVALVALTAHASEPEAPQENASNPLAKAKNTDIRWQSLDADAGTINDVYVDGAFMANDKLKIKYELHYWETNATGQSENGWESTSVKAIYFPMEGKTEHFKYRLAVGAEWIIDLGDEDKGIGFNSDQVAPLVGIAMGFKNNLMLIPLVQHYVSYSGDNVNTTAFRLIALQPFADSYWAKLDAKLPVEWNNDGNTPASIELQLGKNLNQRVALYTDFLAGLSDDRAYDWGLGVGIRFKY